MNGLNAVPKIDELINCRVDFWRAQAKEMRSPGRDVLSLVSLCDEGETLPIEKVGTDLHLTVDGKTLTFTKLVTAEIGAVTLLAEREGLIVGNFD